jgi:mannose-1-phosphate guanylyltransferase/mannose-6-phosphate isomerase
MSIVKPVIMAGGSGTRLWPLSRKSFPKQFVKLFDNQSLLQKTLLRNTPFGRPIVIVSEDHRFIAAEQIREIGVEADLVVEPAPKNTAPCAIIASLLALESNIETVLLLPADHYIEENDKYISLINKAANLTNEVATIGIKPSFAHTGYGYIKTGKQIADKIFHAEKFIEKPEKSIAEEYLSLGNYFWNSGIFLFNANYMLEQARHLQSKLFELTNAAYLSSAKDLDFTRLDNHYYDQLESISIDYAVMEHIESMILLEANFKWNDLGSWESIWEINKKDEHNNYKLGDVVSKDVKNSFIMSDNRLTAVIGLSDVIVVNTADALLVADKSKSEEVKQIVNHLSKLGRIEATEHTRVFRPWGYYQTIDDGELYKVKRIVVHSGHKLSLQCHNHRAEHWVIVRGVAEVIIDGKTSKLTENDSIYIPKGAQHRLSNIGDIDLHLIEVQTGKYLGEDDIVRLGDSYGRR